MKSFAQQLYWLKRGWSQYFPTHVWGALGLHGHGAEGHDQEQWAMGQGPIGGDGDGAAAASDA
eukprot:2262241-Pyramimonas_sp.AAC.1